MRLFTGLISLLYSMVLLGAEPATRFDRLTIEDGLSQSSVYDIHQDNDGFMWFGTRDGLNRYDGYQFKVFRHNPLKFGTISSNLIEVIYQDSKGTLWIGTHGGLNRYDAQTQTFTHFKHSGSQPNSLSNDTVFSIVEDNDGTLWVGTAAGLNRFNANTGTFKRFTSQPDDPQSISHHVIKALYVDQQNALWIGTKDGLNRLDSQTGQISHFKHQPSNANSLSDNYITAIIGGTNNTLWIGTMKSLDRFNPNTQRFERFDFQPSGPININHYGIATLYLDAKQSLWIGHSKLIRLDLQTQRFSHFYKRPSDPHSLGGSQITAIFQDNQGILWFGTSDNGISRYNPVRERFGHYKRQPGDRHGLTYNNTRTLLKGPNLPLLVGSSQATIQQFNERDRTFSQYTDGLPNNTIFTALYQDSLKRVWLGSYNRGILLITADKKQTHFRYDSTNPNSINSDDILSFTQDNQGTMWVGTTAGLNRFNEQTRGFDHYQHDPSNPNSLSDNKVKAIVDDSKGRLWVGTESGGLSRLNRQTQQFTRFIHYPEDPKSLSHNHITSIMQDSSDRLWITTYGGGLNQYNEQTGDFIHYRTEDGLPNNVVYGMLEDESNQLWMSTNKGLSRFNPQTKTFRNYNAGDGLQSNEFNRGAFAKGSDGEMLFGGINGFNRFYPADIKDDTQVPKVVFTDFLLANESVPIQKEIHTDKEKGAFSLPKAINALEHLTLDYTQNLMSFEFAALHFTNPMKNQYAYQLLGWDSHWITADAKIRRATYTNLPSGDYTLHVKASNPDGYWNEQGASIKITIEPAPWRTWWAYTSYAIVLISLVLFGLKAHYERTVLNQLKQVDKLKDQFLANTSHELRTPLNGIIGLSESLIDGIAGQLPQQANQHLSMVVASGRRLASLVNDILDFAKLESHNITLQTQPVNLRNITDMVLVLSHHLTGDKQLMLVNEVPTDLACAQADEERLQQILYNLIGNGIKFTDEGTVTVSAQYLQSNLVIRVKDTGIGIPADKYDTIFDSFVQLQGDATRRYGGTGLGLAVSKQLIELHGGRISVHSTVGKGSTFSFTLPVSSQQAMNDSDVNVALQRIKTMGDDGLQTAQSLSPIDQNCDGYRILLIDDEPINRLVLRGHLSGQNYQLFEAPGGEEALKLLAENGPFDLVLLDIMMPKISGYEVCERIRKDWSVNELPVIFLTARNQPIDAVQSFEVGGNDFLSKPVTKYELLARVETHLKLLESNRNLSEKVTELKQSNQQIIDTQQQLVQAEKMSSLGTLTAGVAHEINNPTNFVHVSAQNLEVDLTRFQQFLIDLAGDDADEEILNSFRSRFAPLHLHLDTIKDGTERIKTIVQDLRTFTQLDNATRKPMDISKALQSTINLVRTQYMELADFEINCTDNSEIVCYPAQLNQVFMNLIVNAVEAIQIKQNQQNDSTITTNKGLIIIKCHRLGEQLEISFKDNGCGMTEETQNKLFEPFYTTKEVGEGTGLSLSITFGIVQKHKGELSVESVLGVGSEFVLRLPVANQAKQPHE
ncbi:MAG: response regulator, partial [Algicola sp.]|nr:response regulator [Algicola sp.]